MATEDPLQHVEVVDSGDYREALVKTVRIRARELTTDHVGKFLGCHDDEAGVNYAAKILAIRHVNEGRAPGVSIKLQHSELPGGRASREESCHVPFGTEIEIIDMVPM